MITDRSEYGHSQTITFEATLRHYRSTAPAVVDEAMLGSVLWSTSPQQLVSMPKPGNIVGRDMLVAYKIVGVRPALEAEADPHA